MADSDIPASEDGLEYDIDFREQSSRCEIGRGEEGVLQPPFSARDRDRGALRHYRDRLRKIWSKKGRLAPRALGGSSRLFTGESMTGDGPEYDIDFRANPAQYDIGRGEQGVFKVEPYKSELLPLWSYKDEAAARESAQAIYEQYERYRDADEFPGMDMARKYTDAGEEYEPEQWADAEKRAAALVFEEYWERVREDDAYQRAKERHRSG